MSVERRIVSVALLVTVAACGEPTGPDALEESSFEASFQGSLERSLSGEASLTEATANFPGEIRQDVWLLSLTAHRPGGRTEIQLVGGTDAPRESTYGVVPFDPPLSEDEAFGLVAVFDADSIVRRYLAESGDVTMTRVTGMEAYGSFRVEALGGESPGDSSRMSASGYFRGYH